MAWEYKQLRKSKIDASGNVEFNFALIEDGTVVYPSNLITCAPEKFDTKVEEQVQGVIERRQALDEIPTEAEVWPSL